MSEEIRGTVLIHPPDEMVYCEFMSIVKAVSEITRVEGGYESSFTLGGDILFFNISEDESDRIRNSLVDRFGEDYVYERLHYAYDDCFD